MELLGLGSLGSEPYAEPRYLGEGGEHIVFSTDHDAEFCLGNPHCEVVQLEPDAAPTGTGTVYDRSADGKTHVVSLLPGDIPQTAGQQAFYKGTAKDGSAVAFEIEETLYVREDDTETQEVAAGKPAFAGLSDEGRYVFYVSGGNVHRFDTSDESDEQLTSTGDAKIVNVSGDGSHLYFVSESQIGGQGEAGKPNLYVWSGSATTYVATVAASDLDHTSGTKSGRPALANWTEWVLRRPPSEFEMGPGNESSRTNPDGTVLVFESKAELTGYENAGHTEIYRWDDEDKSLSCVSCNPLAEPATGDAQLQNLEWVNVPTIVGNLSDDGARVFFESTEALVAGDSDGINDVYEWQKEGGGGSLALISSGQSSFYPSDFRPPPPNVLLSVTGDGEDVVFLSQDALVPGAPQGGVTQIYDARVGGGFAAPAEAVPCAEEACRPATSTSAPSFAGPASEATEGAGNVSPRHRRRRCRARRRRHGRCPKQKSGQRRSRTSVAADSRAPTGAPEADRATPGGGSDTVTKGSPQGGVASAAIAPVTSAGPFDEYGIESVAAELSTYAAGMHPDFTNRITLNHTLTETGEPVEAARTEELAVSLPPGLLGNPNAIPTCETIQLLSSACPVGSQVGVVKVLATFISGELTEPLYNLTPPHPDREVARLGMIAGSYFPAFIDVKVRTASDYGATATVYGAAGIVSLVGSRATLWGNPADPAHDKQRLTPYEANFCTVTGTACKAPGGKRSSGLPPTAFMTNPSACQPMSVGFDVRSYQLPGQLFSATAPMEPITECEGLPFAPSFEATPTSRVAGAPTGLETKLVLPQQSTEAVESPATATLREARVALPAGMQVAAGAANWIGVCSDQQIGYHEEVEADCPDASRIGVAKISSPDLPHPIEGSVYQRAPSPGHQLGLWIAVDRLGLHVKIPGELQSDPNTGRVTAVFKDLPQVPSSEIDLEVWGGPRAPLQNPDSCGTYTTDYSFAPHSNDPPVTGQSEMTIDEGCNRPFSPTLHAGVTEPVAGRFSPLLLDLNREDGEQALGGFRLTLPDGELAKLAGVPLCPEAQIPSGSCPPSSQIGRLQASAGPGPDPLWVPQPGKAQPAIYLAGPYEGAPYSVVSVVPAQAGPFDLGNVVVRSGLAVDPETAQATVEADPLPQFFEGVGLAYRHLHAVVDRLEFALNPSDCSELAVASELRSTLGTLAHPGSRFQVDGCAALPFAPHLSLRLLGSTRRGGFPRLVSHLQMNGIGEAGIASARLLLPHSEFIANAHFRNICTRVQFKEGAGNGTSCPPGSVYGYARAVTPLLDQPLEGPVLLRSNPERKLPDVVAALHGSGLAIDLVGNVDSVKGRLRTVFAATPDAPVSSFDLELQGGPKGLFENSADLCLAPHRASIAFAGQNGKSESSRPLLRVKCRRKPGRGRR